MSWLDKVTPVNLLEEKAKFFADPTYNPQFVYKESLTGEKFNKFGVPKKEYLELALDILKKSYYGRNEQDIFMTEGPILNQKEVTKKVLTFLKMYNLQDRFTITWSSSFVSRTTIDANTIKLRLPVDFRQEGLVGMLYHEIGTHALRRINYEQQPWYKKKKKYGLSEYLPTEEGLAALHALIPHTFKSAFVSAIRYVAVDYAQQHSFAELWKLLGTYIQDPERRWMITFRQKRGMTDTSQPGGYTKDLVYFEGMIEVWQWLEAHDFDITSLYFGKLAFQDAERVQELNPTFEPILPSFYVMNPQEYKEKMLAIGKLNGIDQLKRGQ
jgi:hypothetical protein